MKVFDLSSLVNRRILGPVPGNLTDSSYLDLPPKSSQFSPIRPNRRGSNFRMVRCTRAHRPPSHISKMVLSTVHVGGPTRTELRTFRWEVQI